MWHWNEDGWWEDGIMTGEEVVDGGVVHGHELSLSFAWKVIRANDFSGNEGGLHHQKKRGSSLVFPPRVRLPSPETNQRQVRRRKCENVPRIPVGKWVGLLVFRNERWIFVLLKCDCYERWGFSEHKLDFFSHLLSPKRLRQWHRRCFFCPYITIAISLETGHQKGWFNEKWPNR